MSLLNIERVCHALRRIKATIRFLPTSIEVSSHSGEFDWHGESLGELYDALLAHPEISKVMAEITKGGQSWK